MQTKSTIGSDFLSKELTVMDKPITLQIWDTAGQERFQSLGSSFFRGADAVLFVFDVTRPETFQALGQWRDSFLIQAGIENGADFPMLIIGNKIDADRKVSREEAETWCKSIGNIQFLETSAKDAKNVDKAFETVTKLVVQNLKEEQISYGTVDLNAESKNDSCPC